MRSTKKCLFLTRFVWHILRVLHAVSECQPGWWERSSLLPPLMHLALHPAPPSPRKASRAEWHRRRHLWGRHGCLVLHRLRQLSDRQRAGPPRNVGDSRACRNFHYHFSKGCFCWLLKMLKLWRIKINLLSLIRQTFLMQLSYQLGIH